MTPQRPRVVRVLVLAALALTAFMLLPEMPVENAICATTAADSSWTVMVYMAADVTDPLPWEVDVNEMEAADHAEEVSVIALVDPPGTSNTMLLNIEHDEDLMNDDIVSEIVDDQGEVIRGEGDVNTGSAATLRDFIVFSATEFPADNLVLVLWGHGIGWRGVCPDGTDLLTLPELRTAMSDAKQSIGRGIDLMVLDVCTGATVELAYEVRGLADFLVGSELSVPADGLPYMQVLQALSVDPSCSVADFGETVAETYVEWAEYGSAHPTSSCMFDLRLAGGLRDDLDRVSTMCLRFDRLFHDSLTSTAHSSEHTEESWLVDFGTFSTELCSEELPVEVRAASLGMAIDYGSAVRFFGQSNIDEEDDPVATGLSIYLPTDSSQDSGYLDLAIADTAWPSLSYALRANTTAEASAPGPLLETFDTDGDELIDSATVTWDIDELNYTSYAAHVFQVHSQGLIDCGELLSTTNEITVSGIAGVLRIGATAYVGEEACSYSVIELTLSRAVRLNILLLEGSEAYQGDGTVSLASVSGTPVNLECFNGTCTTEVVVPKWADIGDLIELRVSDAADGTVLSGKTVRLSAEDMTVILQIHRPDEGDTPAVLWIGIAAIGTTLIAAAVLYKRKLRA